MKGSKDPWEPMGGEPMGTKGGPGEPRITRCEGAGAGALQIVVA